MRRVVPMLPFVRSWVAFVVVTGASACGATHFALVSDDGGLDGASSDAGESLADGSDSSKPDRDGQDAGPRVDGAVSPETGTDGHDGETRDSDLRDAGSHDVGEPRDVGRPGDAREDRDASGTSDAPTSCSSGVAACSSTVTCAPPTNLCVQAFCTDGGCCGSRNAPSGTSCGTGHEVCNGMGSCVACASSTDCKATGTVCETVNCIQGACVDEPATSGTQCDENGGNICSGNGTCVQCTSNDTGACTGSTPYCGASDTCVECTTSADCNNALEGCSDGMCVLL